MWDAKGGPTMTPHSTYVHYSAYGKDDYVKDVKSTEALNFDIAAKDRLSAGSPAQCLEQLKMWKEEVQPDYVMLRMRQPGGPPQAEALADIRMFGEQVIPNL